MHKNSLKVVFIILTLLTFNIGCKAQSDNPPIEQIAFNLYETEVLKNLNIKKKIKVLKYLTPVYYISAECLAQKIYNEKNIENYPNSNYFQGYQLNLKNLDLSRFRIVEKINENSNTENYIKVSIAQKNEDRIFVIINELIDNHGKTYTFEFNKTEEVIDWCLSEEYTKIVFE